MCKYGRYNQSARISIDEEKIKEFYNRKDLYNADIYNDAIDNNYEISAEDIEIAIDIYGKALQDNNYQFPSNQVFLNKLEEIFGVNEEILIDKGEYKIFPAGFYDPFEYSVKDIIEISNTWEFEPYAVIFIPKKYNFIFTLPYLFDEIKLEQGNLKFDIPSYLIARNKFLFNEDKSYLNWLIKNDWLFINCLVTVFAYTKNPRILNASFDYNQPSGGSPVSNVFNIDIYRMGYGALFWNRNFSGEIVLLEESFDLLIEKSQEELFEINLSNEANEIEEIDETEEIEEIDENIELDLEIEEENEFRASSSLLDFYYEYCKRLLIIEENILTFTIHQKSKLITRLFYFGEKYFARNSEYSELTLHSGEFVKDSFINWLLFYPDALNDMKINQFYELPHLEEWLEEAKESDWYKQKIHEGWG